MRSKQGLIAQRIVEETKRSGFSVATIPHVMVALFRTLQNESSEDYSERLDYWKSQATNPLLATVELTSGEVITADGLMQTLREQELRETAILEMDAQLRNMDTVVVAGTRPDPLSAEREPEEIVPVSEDGADALPVIEELMVELDDLVGLESTKNQVKQALATHLVNAERKKLGLPTVTNGLNFIFTGSPGTGKTTVARLIAGIFRSAGLLSTGKFLEVSKGELVGQFVGETPKKTLKVLEQVKGGMLFIDEAYSLVAHGAGGYGEEALTTVLQYMENHRDEVSVIMAGYEDEMRNLLSSNAGLRSRFNVFVNFPDYSTSDLVLIFKSMAKAHGIDVPQDVLQGVRTYIEKTETGGESGNGRFVRNLFETMNQKMSVRAIVDGVIEIAELTTFVVDDVPKPGEASTPGKRKIGFG